MNFKNTNMRAEVLSRNCVNSNHIAKFLKVGKNEEHCECGFKCKIKVSIEINGHKPYTYVLTKKEYKKVFD